MKKAIRLSLLVFLLTGCQLFGADKDAEISSLQSQVAQQKKIIESLQRTTAEVDKLKELTESVMLPTLQILDRLDALDQKFTGALMLRGPERRTLHRWRSLPPIMR